ncbi:hypothetical protein [Kitasatospora sp. NPDC094015]|uniref:hypothetical protein n=1 Tax=Kitasatospora sp. NPDC094015 TaxID=3155205 RepID=UPI00331A8C4E
MTAMTGPAVRDALRDAAPQLLGPGVRAAELPLLGARALVFHRPDPAECDRRRTAGAERLNRITALQTLLALPVALPVDLAALGPAEREAVRSLPAGAARTGERSVTRLAVRPLAVDLVVVRAAGRRDPLQLAGRYAPFARRAVLLGRTPAGAVASHQDLLVAAAFYGIGVFAEGPDGIRALLEPAPYRPQRHTAAAWHFVEELYERLR